ncbi:MAG: hypothetical protein IKZ62_09035 [Prevotella sp.]|nr:hypothetical protein [Prevotella sp.]
MSNFVIKYREFLVSMLLGIVVFLFWLFVYPHALSYQEQYQLFLWTGDYFANSMSIPGGFACWLGELVMQFYYVPWLGALLLAVVFVVFAWIVGWIPAMLLFGLLGDPAVTLGYVMAVILSQGTFRLNKTEGKKGLLVDIGVIPLLFWLTGPIALLYVLLRITKLGIWGSIHIVYLLAVALMSYRFLLDQRPLEIVLTPTLYYRISLETNSLMWVIPLVALMEYVIIHLKFVSVRKGKIFFIAYSTVCLLIAWISISNSYNKELYELIRQDYLVRNECWDEIVQRAEKYQVNTAFSSVCVNLALAKKRQLAERMFEFYQNGEDALIMPYYRDNTTMLPTAETFWHLGMVNSAQRYMFDTQETILNGKLSGRCTKRIAECMLVNGHYQTAVKQIRILKKTLFYRSWAEEAETMLGNEEMIDAHPVYGKLRKLRFHQEHLYSYREIDELLRALFMENKNNKMALDYYMGQLLLKSKIGQFRRNIPMVQQYGGYEQMPNGYVDALNAIANGGRVMGSAYVEYVNRVLQTKAQYIDTTN